MIYWWILNIFRDETPRYIILSLLLYIECSRVEIHDIIEKDAKTITFHLKRLLDLNIIELVQTIEFLKNNPEERLRLGTNAKNKVMNDV